MGRLAGKSSLLYPQYWTGALKLYSLDGGSHFCMGVCIDPRTFHRIYVEEGLREGRHCPIELSAFHPLMCVGDIPWRPVHRLKPFSVLWNRKGFFPRLLQITFRRVRAPDLAHSTGLGSTGKQEVPPERAYVDNRLDSPYFNKEP